MKRPSSLIAVLLATCGAAQAAGDVSRLGKDLNAYGGEVAASKDGHIPAYGTEDPYKPGWAQGKNRFEFYKYKDDKALFVIDASNVDQHADKLAPALVKLIKTKGYKAPVYPTRRTCRALDFVAANTKKNVSAAKIGADGWSLEGAVLPGVAFPMPEKGIEVIWNYLSRYAGAGVLWTNQSSYISPRPGTDTGVRIRWNMLFSYPYGSKGENVVGSQPFYLGLWYGFVDPAALSGQSIMQRFFYDKPIESYYYFPGQRRVRRLPSYDYDAPILGYENVLTADTQQVLFGAPDRFDWKLVGKKEMYVPANAFGMNDHTRKFSDVAKPDHIDESALRYELRRVWVVESTVKQGIRHSSPKRVFYFDEDSWIAVGSEDYDGQGQLQRWKEMHSFPASELGNTCIGFTYVGYDLISGRYVADVLPFEAEQPKVYLTTDDPKFKPSYYSAESLQRIGDR